MKMTFMSQVFQSLGKLQLFSCGVYEVTTGERKEHSR